MAAARVHLVIKGLVQGVWYRAYTERTAKALGLMGWVRNLPDGSVEAVMEGERAAIDLAILECRKGPPSSRVEKIEEQWESPNGEFAAFEVRN